MSYNFAPF